MYEIRKITLRGALIYYIKDIVTEKESAIALDLLTLLTNANKYHTLLAFKDVDCYTSSYERRYYYETVCSFNSFATIKEEIPEWFV